MLLRTSTQQFSVVNSHSDVLTIALTFLEGFNVEH